MKYVIGALAGVIGLFLLIGLFTEADSGVIQRQCLNSGRLVTGGNVYECKFIGKEIKS